MLSAVEKIIFLKEVPFFRGLTVPQLTGLARVCEEETFPAEARIFSQGEPGGVLYVIVSGKVAVDQERKGTTGPARSGVTRLAVIEANASFGEMELFDNSPRAVSAIALQDTLTLRLRREPLLALVRQNPGLALELINVLSQQLNTANERVAELTRTRPRELHKFFDKFDAAGPTPPAAPTGPG